MRDRIKEVSEIINLSFDLLDLIVVRVALFGLAAIGAYSLLTKH
jgi:hypothetical protein